jgi:hypothetical protein
MFEEEVRQISILLSTFNFGIPNFLFGFQLSISLLNSFSFSTFNFGILNFLFGFRFHFQLSILGFSISSLDFDFPFSLDSSFSFSLWILIFGRSFPIGWTWPDQPSSLGIWIGKERPQPPALLGHAHANTKDGRNAWEFLPSSRWASTHRFSLLFCIRFFISFHHHHPVQFFCSLLGIPSTLLFVRSLLLSQSSDSWLPICSPSSSLWYGLASWSLYARMASLRKSSSAKPSCPRSSLPRLFHSAQGS